jgi:choline dehydrogenase-like flavoprotein
LEDHLSTGLEFSCIGPITIDSELRFDRLALSSLKWLFAGDGTMAYFPFGGSAYIRTRPELDRPDIQFLIRNASAQSRVWFPGIRPRVGDAVACRLTQLHPESTGSVTLRSADPEAKPKILHNYLASANDLRSMRDGIKAARRVFAQKPLSDLLSGEKDPGARVRSDDEIDAYIRATGTTIFHPVATCRMGPGDTPDRTAVVDARLRVKGVERVRVVDASVMPHVTGSNTNAPTIMIAEKAADMIRGRPPLPAAGA